MAKKPAQQDANNKPICDNRRAFHDYSIDDTVEAGIVLVGGEVKSCREGKAQLKDAYVIIRNGEAYLLGAHIAEYAKAAAFPHDVTRTRKLLLHREEIAKLDAKIRERGLVVIPTKMYFKQGKVKVLLGVGKGRTHGDRRERIKERDVDRELRRATRRAR